MVVSRRVVVASILALGLTLALRVPTADATQEAGRFVADLSERAIALMADKQATNEEQETRFRQLLREGFAIPSIGRFVLGPHLRRASDAEVEEFLNLFEDYIVSLYAAQFREYSGEMFEVRRVIDMQTQRGDLQVVSEIVRAGQSPLRVDFQVRPVQDSYKILDVRFEGVSMIIAQRDDFSTFITNNGGRVEVLNEELRKKTANLVTRAAQVSN